MVSIERAAGETCTARLAPGLQSHAYWFPYRQFKCNLYRHGMSAVKRPRTTLEDGALPRVKRGRPLKVDAAKRQDELLDHTLEQFMAVGDRAATI